MNVLNGPAPGSIYIGALSTRPPCYHCVDKHTHISLYKRPCHQGCIVHATRMPHTLTNTLWDCVQRPPPRSLKQTQTLVYQWVTLGKNSLSSAMKTPKREVSARDPEWLMHPFMTHYMLNTLWNLRAKIFHSVWLVSSPSMTEPWMVLGNITEWNDQTLTLMLCLETLGSL